VFSWSLRHCIQSHEDGRASGGVALGLSMAACAAKLNRFRRSGFDLALVFEQPFVVMEYAFVLSPVEELINEDVQGRTPVSNAII